MTRVLIIEDEASSLEVAKKMLNRLGITDICCASNGLTGLKVLDRMDPSPNVVICDIFMPEMDGVEMVSELANRNFAGNVILISGVDAQVLDIARNIGMGRGLHISGVLSKPIDEVLLAQALPQVGA